MASGTSMLPFADAEIKMRWREPYVTEGLNKKLAGITPRGIYRGFHLGENGAPMLLEVLADTVKGDHVAVYETDTAVAERYSLRVELVGGDFTLDLTAWPSQLVYIAIYAEYSTLGTTSASLRVYTEAEYAGAVEKDELIVLGTVNVPALGNPIPAADINEDFRTFPWDNQAPDARDWNPILRNGGFDAGPTVAALPKGMIPFWTHYPDSSNTNMVFGTTTADKRSGVQSLLLEVLATVATSISLGYGDLIAVTEGQRFKWKLSYKPVQTLSAGTLQFKIQYLDDDVSGYALSTVVLHTIDTSVTGSWIDVEGSGVVPAGVKYIYSVSIASVSSPTPNFPATGDAIFFDQLQVWLEPDLGDGSNPEDAVRRQKLDVQRIDFTSTAAETGGGDPALINGGTGPELRRRDQDADASTQPKILSAGGMEAGSALITPSSGAVFEGKTSGTARYQGEVRDSAVAPNLMTYWKVGGVNPSMYEYACPTLFGRFLTYNSYWRYADLEWRCNLAGSDATAIQQNSAGVVVAWHPATAGTWAHGAWSPLLSVLVASNETLVTNLRTGIPDTTQPAINVGNGIASGAARRFIRVFPYATTYFGREYSDGNIFGPRHFISYNASWDGTNYTADDTTNAAMVAHWTATGFLGTFSGLYLWAKDFPIAGTWNDSGWTRTLGLGHFRQTSLALLAGLQLESDTATLHDGHTNDVTNTLYNRNIVKAWCVVSAIAGGAPGPVGAEQGYNISGVTQDASGYLVITLAAALNGMNQISVVVNFHDGTTTADHTASATILATNVIRVACWANGAFASALTYTNRISVIVMGVS